MATKSGIFVVWRWSDPTTDDATDREYMARIDAKGEGIKQEHGVGIISPCLSDAMQFDRTNAFKIAVATGGRWRTSEVVSDPKIGIYLD